MIAVICVIGAGVLLLALDLCTDGHAHEFRAE
jgi:hypothetical protein